MSVSYRPANDEAGPIGERLYEELFPDLVEADATVNYILAESDTPGVAAVKHQGYPAWATVKVNSVLDRFEGKRDVTITIDAERWDEMTNRQREGLIAHELRHLVLKRDKKTGEFKTDAVGRPVLGCCKHDWVLGGFEDIARRFGADAPEVAAAQEIKDKYGQLLFDWPEFRVGGVSLATA